MDNFLANRIPFNNHKMHFRAGTNFFFSSHLSLSRCTSRLIYGALTSPTTGFRAQENNDKHARALGVRFVLRLRESRVIAGSDLAGGLQLRFFAARQLSHRSLRRRKRAEVIARARSPPSAIIILAWSYTRLQSASIALLAIHLGAHYFASYESISAIPSVSLVIPRGQAGFRRLFIRSVEVIVRRLRARDRSKNNFSRLIQIIKRNKFFEPGDYLYDLFSRDRHKLQSRM